MAHLFSLYARRAELNAVKRDLAQDLETRKLALTPIDAEGIKALGPNEKAQLRGLEKLWAADAKVAKLSDAIASIEHELTVLSGDIEAAEAERRAEEWAVRSRYVRTREVEMGIEPQPVGAHGEAMIDDDTAPQYFDDIDF
jgi:hypothetical protein